MKTLRQPLFIASMLLAALNQLLEHNGIFIPIVHSYLDDLLCFPIVHTVGLATYRSAYQDHGYILGVWQVWLPVLLYALMFEWVLPSYSPVYRADVLDVVAYCTGTLIFVRWVNRP